MGAATLCGCRCRASGEADRGGAHAAGGQGRAHPVFEEVRKQRTEYRGTERAADGAEERHTRGGDAEVFEIRRVLHDQDQHLHGQADAGAQDDQEDRLHQRRGGRLHARHQQKRERHQRGAGHREDLVAAGPADQGAAAGRGDQHPDHHRQRAQTRGGSRDAVHVLHVRRQERHRAQHREADHERQHTTHGEHRTARTAGSAGSVAAHGFPPTRTRRARRPTPTNNPMIVGDPHG